MPSAEGVRDLMGRTLVDGDNISIVVDDAANTITVSVAQALIDRIEALENPA